MITFLITSLVFPVATTWGTFLHAAGPFHVLLVISALLALDAGLARLGSRMGWTRPVAWLGAMLGIFASILFSAALLPTFGNRVAGNGGDVPGTEHRGWRRSSDRSTKRAVR